MGIENITQERSARRFSQINILNRQLDLKNSEIAQAQAHVKELKTEADGLFARIRTAARDEGELPLFDLNE